MPEKPKTLREILEDYRDKHFGATTQENLDQAISEIKALMPDEGEIKNIVSLKLGQLIIEDKPDRLGYTKSGIISEAIHDQIQERMK